MRYLLGSILALLAGTAWAQSSTEPQGSQLMSFLPLILIFAVFYFLMIRPQQKRAKEHKQMVAALGKGDEVVTTGGMLGKVTDLGENFVAIKVADNVEIKVQRQAVTMLMPKGTMKEL